MPQQSGRGVKAGGEVLFAFFSRRFRPPSRMRNDVTQLRRRFLRNSVRTGLAHCIDDTNTSLFRFFYLLFFFFLPAPFFISPLYRPNPAVIGTPTRGLNGPFV